MEESEKKFRLQRRQVFSWVFQSVFSLVHYPIIWLVMKKPVPIIIPIIIGIVCAASVMLLSRYRKGYYETTTLEMR
jgi:hypothetical protein